MRRLSFIVVVALVLAIAAAAQAAPIKLEYKFKKGDVDNYKMTMEMKMSSPDMSSSAQTMKVTAAMTQKIVDIYSDGSAKIRTTISNMKTVGGDPSGSRGQKTEPVTTTMIMRKDGRVKSVVTSGKQPGAGLQTMDFSQFMGQASPSFPSKKVSVGDMWRQEVPFPMGGGSLTADSKLLDTSAKVGSTKTAKISQTVSGTIDLAQVMKNLAASKSSNGLPEVSGTMDVSGVSTVYFSPSVGKALKTDAVSSMTMRIAMPASEAGEKPGAMKMIMNMKMSLVKVN